MGRGGGAAPGRERSRKPRQLHLNGTSTPARPPPALRADRTNPCLSREPLAEAVSPGGPQAVQEGLPLQSRGPSAVPVRRPWGPGLGATGARWPREGAAGLQAEDVCRVSQSSCGLSLHPGPGRPQPSSLRPKPRLLPPKGPRVGAGRRPQTKAGRAARDPGQLKLGNIQNEGSSVCSRNPSLFEQASTDERPGPPPARHLAGPD